MAHITRLQVPLATIGESPVWNEKAQRLEWVDVIGKSLFSAASDGSDAQSVNCSDYPGCLALRQNGGRLVAFRRDVRLFDAEGNGEQIIPIPDFRVEIERFNEGACDSRGRFWVGTLDRNVKQPVGGLFCIDPDLSSRRVLGEVTLGNGVAWSPDEQTMYHCDSGPRAIHAYTYDIKTGELSDRRLFAAFAEDEGMPDGCAVDCEGHLWVAAPGAGAVLRFASDGARSGKIHLPTREPTSLTFGGDALATMFVTSMRKADTTAGDVSDGALYAIDAGVKGLPRHRFGG